MKHTAHSLKIKHKHVSNREEERLEDEGKAKHAVKHKMACKHCKSTSHTTAEHHKHEKRKAAGKASRFENMRRKVFGIKKPVETY